ncbi:hypothetical protein L873DRAFT_1794531 [Choiromyces venosus 120613-1]|uniref:Uncharacterized protein n=1 Tax=Choiromyces venosus 120613-1 TaxID=1336337 RepID=A0A3N4J1E8_9PEZI|nr:hypothetical protein L873DRAFT_1794531 [Choiromyces venosus 120613-1]
MGISAAAQIVDVAVELTVTKNLNPAMGSALPACLPTLLGNNVFPVNGGGGGLWFMIWGTVIPLSITANSNRRYFINQSIQDLQTRVLTIMEQELCGGYYTYATPLYYGGSLARPGGVVSYPKEKKKKRKKKSYDTRKDTDRRVFCVLDGIRSRRSWGALEHGRFGCAVGWGGRVWFIGIAARRYCSI